MSNKVTELISNTVETIEGFIVNFSEEETQNLIEHYIYKELYPRLFNISDDAEMKNQQIREKVRVLQTKVKPKMLGIDKKNLDMKFISQAVNGYLNRNQQNQQDKKSKRKIPVIS